MIHLLDKKYFLILLSCFAFMVLNTESEALNLRSTAFMEGDFIPFENTGFGMDYSPDLEWTDIPEGTRSFVIIMDDPDAPMGVWVHWIVYNIPGDIRTLKKNIKKNVNIGNYAMQGINSFKSIGYDGPYPPPGGPHRYIFKLYALDTFLELNSGSTKRELEKSMEGHVLDSANLTGLYKRL